MPLQFYFTKHALIEMDNDSIGLEDVKQVALNGEVIKVYPDDKKGLSQLMFGMAGASPVHVVCSHHGETIHIITAYKPNPELWEADFKTRKTRKS
ncbi:MAG: DUF4258 domain-containing protein [Cyclobacteriaceae bacterium]|nr:DUF4258 domain-containing protein [Cyclobacteriaceae bacterium]